VRRRRSRSTISSPWRPPACSTEAAGTAWFRISWCRTATLAGTAPAFPPQNFADPGRIDQLGSDLAATADEFTYEGYNGVAAIAALTLLPFLARRIGKVKTHILGLLCGALGYASFFLFKDANQLLIAEVGVGIAWASILAMPYAILASNLPQKKLGIYMGLFNVFVVVPQLLVATVMGSIMKAFFPDEPIYTMAFAAAVMALAALAMTRVSEEKA